MITQFECTRSEAVTRVSGTADRRPARVNLGVRLIQVALAVYLVPALLIVLVVGGIGVVILTVARLFSGSGRFGCRFPERSP
jgi:hypothetical protein